MAISSTLVATAIGTLGAYALARLRFMGRAFMSSAVLITYLVPPAILFIPLYAQIRTFGLADSLAGLIACYPSFTVPFVLPLAFVRDAPPGDARHEKSGREHGCRRPRHAFADREMVVHGSVRPPRTCCLFD